VGIDDSAELASDVSAQIARIESVEAVATQPGEIAGPAIRVTVEVANGTDTQQDLRAAVVNASYGDDDIPADPMTSPGGSPLPASVEPGASAKGVYLFAIPKDERDKVAIVLDLRLGGKVVVFEGAVPN